MTRGNSDDNNGFIAIVLLFLMSAVIFVGWCAIVAHVTNVPMDSLVLFGATVGFKNFFGVPSVPTAFLVTWGVLKIFK